MLLSNTYNIMFIEKKIIKTTIMMIIVIMNKMKSLDHNELGAMNCCRL